MAGTAITTPTCASVSPTEEAYAGRMGTIMPMPSCRSAELTSTTPSCVFACCVSTSPRSDESPLSLSALPPLPPLVLPLPLLPLLSLPLLSLLLLSLLLLLYPAEPRACRLLSVLLPPLRPVATRC